MKKYIVYLLAFMMIVAFSACGKDGNTNETSGDSKPKEGPVYTLDANSIEEIEPAVYPADYPLIASADFKTSFAKLEETNLNGEVGSYPDVVKMFGADGAYYKNCDMDYNGDVMKYYGWFSDNEESVLIFFKENGDKLEYYGYTPYNIE